ncbi:hypothetical protein EDB85DRAFT_2155054 [Lactarius pseudohatsudake]|nr:hypothetical protein EDB85DRAFT_2155054 [Lactarius pseudohatsudake]
MPGVVFVIGFALLAFAYDLCAQGCALPFRSPPRAAHRVRPRSPLEGCLGIEIIGGEFFLNAIGSLPVRGRTVALSGQALPPPVHIRWVRRLLPMGVPDYLGRYCSSTRSGQIVNTARARESFMPYAIGSGSWLPPVRITSLLFPYAFGSYCTIAHARENSHVRAIGSVLSPPVLPVFSVSIHDSDPAMIDFDISDLQLWLCRVLRRSTSRLRGVFDSVIFRGVCLLRHQLLMSPPLFRPRPLPSDYPTSGHIRQRLHLGLATFYGIGIMPLVSRVGVGLVLAHCRELLAQIGESVKRSRMPSFPVQRSSSCHWVVSSNCPHFRRRGTVTDIHFRRRGTVTDIRSCATPAHGRLSRAGIICSSNTFTASLHAVCHD